VRKLALLGAIGILWLFVAAIPAFADGGPHVMTTNNGTAGLTADSCAGCHRAHTATAASLLNTEQPELCLNCHDGSKATTDIVDGVQYSGTAKTAPILGALRGGGYQYALVDSSNAARLSYLSGGSVRNIGHVQPLATNAAQAITSTHGGTGGVYNAGWGTGTVWGNGAASGTPSFGATVNLGCASCHNPHGNGQYRILQSTPDFPAAEIVSGTWTKSTFAVQVSDTTTTGTHNYTIKPASDGANANGSAANIVTADSGDYWRYHWDPTGTLSWALTSGGPGADPMNTGWNGASATNATAYGTASTTLAAGAGVADTTIAVASAAGFPATPFFVTVDSETMQVTTVAGTTFTVSRHAGGSTAAAHNSGATVAITAFKAQGTNGASLMNATGLMAAWCIQCHTRYSGLTVNGNASSLADNSGGDAVFMYKHGTTRIGCEQCHLSHGSNALMTGSNSSNYTTPSGQVPPKVNNAGSAGNVTSGDSRLLKVDNRGTCQMCHDPTGTVAAGTYVGPLPTPGN